MIFGLAKLISTVFAITLYSYRSSDKSFFNTSFKDAFRTVSETRGDLVNTSSLYKNLYWLWLAIVLNTSSIFALFTLSEIFWAEVFATTNCMLANKMKIKTFI